jgi:hypothetical protein
MSRDSRLHAQHTGRDGNHFDGFGARRTRKFGSFDEGRAPAAPARADRIAGERPHSSLGYATPAEYAANLIATGDRLRNARPACCYIRALGRIKLRDSSRHWMKLQGQVTGKADSKKDEIASRSAFSIGDYIGRLDPATGKVAEWPSPAELLYLWSRHL